MSRPSAIKAETIYFLAKVGAVVAVVDAYRKARRVTSLDNKVEVHATSIGEHQRSIGEVKNKWNSVMELDSGIGNEIAEMKKQIQMMKEKDSNSWWNSVVKRFLG